MTIYGVDTTNIPTAAVLQENKKSFAIGYVAHNLRKCWTTPRIRELLTAGIGVVFVFEDTANRALDGYQAGRDDATFAAAGVAAHGAPATQPIYFAVDFQVIAAQQTAVRDYFRGVSSVIGLARTGVYGSYGTVGLVMDANLAEYAWQTMAWSGVAVERRANIYQYANGSSLGGTPVDLDKALKGDFGQWQEMVDPTPPAPKPAPAPVPIVEPATVLTLTFADVKAVAAEVVSAIRTMPVDVRNYAEHPGGAAFEEQKGRPFLAAFQDLCAYGSNASDKISDAVKPKTT